jgi:hypothetical protein
MVDVCVALDLLLPLLSNTIYETGATSHLFGAQLAELDVPDGRLEMKPDDRLKTLIAAGLDVVLDGLFEPEVQKLPDCLSLERDWQPILGVLDHLVQLVSDFGTRITVDGDSLAVAVVEARFPTPIAPLLDATLAPSAS